MIISISREELSVVVEAVGACGAPLRKFDELFEDGRIFKRGERIVVDTLRLYGFEGTWAEQHLSGFEAPELASALRANAFRVGRMVVRAAQSAMASMPRWDDSPLVRRMRFRRAKSWRAIAGLVDAYETIVLPGGSERIPGLVTRWLTHKAAWWDSSSGLDSEWVVPTNLFDLRVSEYTHRDGREIRISRSPRTRAEIRAERAAKQATYEHDLAIAAGFIRWGDMVLVDAAADAPRGVYVAYDGQEGGTLSRYVTGAGHTTVSLPGALRRAGVNVAEGEAPIDALRRHLADLEPERRATRLRSMPARLRRLPAGDMARAMD